MEEDYEEKVEFAFRGVIVNGNFNLSFEQSFWTVKWVPKTEIPYHATYRALCVVQKGVFEELGKNLNFIIMN